jgi:hypothetical protein
MLVRVLLAQKDQKMDWKYVKKMLFRVGQNFTQNQHKIMLRRVYIMSVACSVELNNFFVAIEPSTFNRVFLLTAKALEKVSLTNSYYEMLHKKVFLKI